MRTSALALLFMCSGLAQAQPAVVDSVRLENGVALSFESSVMGEPWTIHVALPTDFDPERSYPVVYHFDGTPHFALVSGLAHYLTLYEAAPPLIVVGIEQHSRSYELIPPVAEETASRYPNTRIGGGDQFLRFLSDEVIPLVDAQYSTAPFRVLAGHSNGGLFALYALAERPDLFHAALSASPSLHWDNAATVGRVMAALDDDISPGPQPQSFLYLTIGTEGRRYRAAVDSLAARLETKAPSDLAWRFEDYPSEAHPYTFIPTYRNGLVFVFDGIALPRDTWDEIEGGAFALFGEHFRDASARFGFPVVPTWSDFELLGNAHLAHDDFDGAEVVYEEYQRAYPDLPGPYGNRASLSAERGDTEAALGLYRRALQIARANPDWSPMVAIYEREIAELEVE